MDTPKAHLLHLNPQLQARLETLASRNGCTLEQLVEMVMRAHVETAEDDRTYDESRGAVADLEQLSTSERLRRHFAGVDITGFELPERSIGREPPRFS